MVAIYFFTEKNLQISALPLILLTHTHQRLIHTHIHRQTVSHFWYRTLFAKWQMSSGTSEPMLSTFFAEIVCQNERIGSLPRSANAWPSVCFDRQTNRHNDAQTDVQSRGKRVCKWTLWHNADVRHIWLHPIDTAIKRFATVPMADSYF